MDKDLENSLLNRIEQAKSILQKISNVSVDGISKLRNKTKQEWLFLKKIYNNGSYKKDHLSCSNLKHLEALADHLLRNQKVCLSVLCNKVLTEEYGSVRKLCVDIVLHGGSAWVKVIARNPKALTLLSAGGGCYGQKSILEQAEQFIECSKQHLHYYKPPSVVFYFAYGIETVLASELEELGIVVEGIRLDPETNNPVPSDELQTQLLNESHALPTPIPVENSMVKCPIRELEIVHNEKAINELTTKRLNLCVSTMLAYVSALTNGGSHRFKTDLLKLHAEWERARPVKPILDRLFEGRDLYCCKTAKENFMEIVNILGGPCEKKRAKELLERVIIVEDTICDKLAAGGRVKYRSMAVFGTGEVLEAITVTANHGFVRSAINRGVNFSVFLHESRALTEGKELKDVEDK